MKYLYPSFAKGDGCGLLVLVLKNLSAYDCYKTISAFLVGILLFPISITSLFASERNSTEVVAELVPIIPILECIEDLGDGRFKATFGYDNPNGTNITVPKGNSRIVWNGTLRQVKVFNKFKPGVHESVVEAIFDVTTVEDGLKWIIRIPKKASREAPADASSPICEPDISSIENFEAIAVSTTQIDLSWDEPAANEPFTYTIERSLTGGDPWEEVVAELPQSTTSFSDFGLMEFTIYFYRIYAGNMSGTSDFAITQKSTLSPVTTISNNNGKSDNNIELSVLALEAGLTDGNPFNFYTLNPDETEVLIEIIPVPSELANVVTDLIEIFDRTDADFALGSAQIYIDESKNIVDVFFPIVDILELKDDPRIKLVRNAYKPGLSNNGLGETGVISQGDIAQTSDKAKQSFFTKRENEQGELEMVPIDGTGVSITVISDSWSQQPVSEGNPSRYQTDMLNFDLPGILNEKRPEIGEIVDLPGFGTDEGRAMAQAIHDVAPGALLSFRTGFLSYNNFIEAIRQASEAGQDVICEDLTYPQAPILELTGPFFQEITTHVNRKMGNAYVHSSGNFKNDALQGIFDPIPLPATSDMYPAGVQGYAHQFSAGDIFQEVTVNPGADYIFVLQWQDAGGWASHGDPGALVDLDMYITNTEARVEAGNNFISFEKDPLEVMVITSETARTANLMITCEGCTDPVPFRLIALKTSGPSGGLIFNEPWDAPTIAGAGLSDETITVGASAWFDYGNMESFSTFAGPLPNGLTSQITITGPDGANNTALGQDINEDPDIFPNAFGTSFAAPHVAGGLALVMQAINSYFEGAGLPSGILSDASYNTGDPADESLGLLLQTTGPVDNPLQGGGGVTQVEEALKLIAAQTPQLISFEAEPGKTISAEPVLVTFQCEFCVPDSKILLNGVELPTSYIGEIEDSPGVFELQAVVPPFSGGAPNSLAVSSTPSMTPSGFDGGAGPAIDLLLGQIAVTIQVPDKLLEFGQDFTYSESDLMVTGLPEGETLASLGFPEVEITTTAQVTYPDVGFYTANASFVVEDGETEPVIPEGYVVTFNPGVLSFSIKDLQMIGPELIATYGDLSTFTTTNIIANTEYVFDATNIADVDDFMAKIREEHEGTFYQEDDGIVVINRFSPVANENPTFALEQLIEESNWMTTETSITNRFSPVANDFNILELDAERLIEYLQTPDILEINPEQNRFSAVANGAELVLGMTQLYEPDLNRFTPVANRFTAVANRFSPVANQEVQEEIPLGEEDDQTDYSGNLAIVDALDGTVDPENPPVIKVFSINVLSGLDVTTEGQQAFVGLGMPLSNFFYNFNWTTLAGNAIINPMPVTFDLDDGDEEPFVIDYGEDPPADLSSTITPTLAYDDQGSVEYLLDTSEDPVGVGEYTIQQSVTIADADGIDKTFNYTITTIDGSLVVNPATLVLTPENALITSGDDFPSSADIGYSLTGLIEGETVADAFPPSGPMITYSNTAYEAAGRAAGTYVLAPSITPDPANYSLVINEGQLYVNLADGKRIRVYLDCVADNKGQNGDVFPFTAYFRYENDNDVSIFIEPMSPENLLVGTSFDPSSLPFEYLPGSHQFPVPFVGELRYEVATFGSTHQTSQQVDSENLKGWKCKPNEILNGRTANLELEGNNQPEHNPLEFDKSNLRFYPNPILDRLTVIVPHNFGPKDFELYSSTGIHHDVRAVINQGQSTVEFDFTNFETGLYLLKLNIEGTTAVIRVLRE